MITSWHWWYTPVILATWKAEIRKIMVLGEFQQIVQETLPQKYPTQKRAGGVDKVVECLPT
jgi:hypothetical protein